VKGGGGVYLSGLSITVIDDNRNRLFGKGGISSSGVHYGRAVVDDGLHLNMKKSYHSTDILVAHHVDAVQINPPKKHGHGSSCSYEKVADFRGLDAHLAVIHCHGTMQDVRYILGFDGGMLSATIICYNRLSLFCTMHLVVLPCWAQAASMVCCIVQRSDTPLASDPHAWYTSVISMSLTE
jgi:hypothetical protein